MKDLADQMNNAWNFSNYVVVPLIGGAQWSVGTSFQKTGDQIGAPDFPCEFLTNSVHVVSMNDWPSFTSSHAFSFSAGAPSAISSIISANAGIATLTFTSMTLTNLSQKVVGETDLQTGLTTNYACHNSILNTTRAIIRGYICGCLNIQSTNSHAENLAITTPKYGNFTVTNSRVNGLSLQQTTPTNWFAIVSDESLTVTNTTADNAIQALLANGASHKNASRSYALLNDTLADDAAIRSLVASSPKTPVQVGILRGS